MGFPLPPGEGTQGGGDPIEYRVRLTHVSSIKLEYVTYSPLPGPTQFPSSALQGFLQGVQSRDNTVSAVTTVRAV
jgi:hypothetical protein